MAKLYNPLIQRSRVECQQVESKDANARKRRGGLAQRSPPPAAVAKSANVEHDQLSSPTLTNSFRCRHPLINRVQQRRWSLHGTSRTPNTPLLGSCWKKSATPTRSRKLCAQPPTALATPSNILRLKSVRGTFPICCGLQWSVRWRRRVSPVVSLARCS